MPFAICKYRGKYPEEERSIIYTLSMAFRVAWSKLNIGTESSLCQNVLPHCFPEPTWNLRTQSCSNDWSSGIMRPAWEQFLVLQKQELITLKLYNFSWHPQTEDDLTAPVIFPSLRLDDLMTCQKRICLQIIVLRIFSPFKDISCLYCWAAC